MRTMLIEWPDLGVTVEAEMLDDKNPDMINEIWDNLPMEAVQEHAMVTGKSMYSWVPMISLAKPQYQMMIKDTPPGVVSYSQKTGNKLIVRYGECTEDLLTPVLGFIKKEQLKDFEKVAEAVWQNYSHGKGVIKVIFKKGREK